MTDLAPFVALDLPTTTVYALFFLLGSLTVSGLSDLRRMSAQREFLEVWLLFTLVLFGLDAWNTWQAHGGTSWVYLAVKWILIATLALLSWERIGVFFHLAAGDVWAIAAVCALLNPLFILAFYALLAVSNAFLRTVLLRFGRGNSYPFIPVVLAATVATLALVLLGVGSRLQGWLGV